MSYSQSIILIPTLNEKENLGKLIPGIFSLMPDVSILIVDDNSGDGTPELVKELGARFQNLFLLRRTGSKGYGRSSIDGFRWAIGRGYEIVVTMDADFSHDFNAIPSMINKLNPSFGGKDGVDVVVGSRYVKGGGVANWNFFRRILSRFANFYVKFMLNLPVKDATTGFNTYKAGILEEVRLDKIVSEGYAFLVELKFRLSECGYKFVEYPIIFSERREGQSKMSLKIIWESVWLPWRLKSKNF